MPKVSEKHRAARRDQIVDAALRCFARTGFHRTSMSDIIAEAGLSAGAIYLHFDGKQQIALAVGRRILANRLVDVHERLHASDVLPHPSDVLRLMMSGLSSDVRDPALLVQLWGEAVTDPEVSSMVGPIFADVRGIMGPYLTGWAVARGQNPDAAAAWADELVPIFMGLGQGYIVQSTLVPGFDSEHYFVGVAKLFDGQFTRTHPAPGAD